MAIRHIQYAKLPSTSGKSIDEAYALAASAKASALSAISQAADAKAAAEAVGTVGELADRVTALEGATPEVFDPESLEGATLTVRVQEPTPFSDAATGPVPASGESGGHGTGVEFVVTRSVEVAGVKFYSAKTSGHTVKCSLWRLVDHTQSGTAVRVATVDVAMEGAGEGEGLFATPYVIPATDAGTHYAVTTFVTDWQTYIYPTHLPANGRFNVGRSLVFLTRGANYSLNTDAYPISQSSSATYPVDPIVYVDEELTLSTLTLGA